jgi:leader peptidase (prepilin peptidase)/N-methyltransferase
LVEIIGFAVLGLLLGSFANVLIWRIPQKMPWGMVRSQCPKCQSQIAWYDNLPVLSYLILRTKCRKCGVKISIRYPLVELIMCLLFVGAFLKFGWTWTLLEILIFLFGLVVVSFIDLDHMILPDVFTLSGIVIGLVGSVLNPEREFLPSLTGVLLGGGFLWCIAYLYFLLRKEEGMGGGDIKLLAWIGAVLGWTSVPFVILCSSLVGSLIGILLVIKTKGGLKAAIPFGPYLALGAVIYIFGGEQIGLWYIRLFLPSLV